MAFYISGPTILFETNEISTHPNSTQQESNYIYLYTTNFGTSIQIRLNRKFESTEFEKMRVNCSFTHFQFCWIIIQISLLCDFFTLKWQYTVTEGYHGSVTGVVYYTGELIIIFYLFVFINFVNTCTYISVYSQRIVYYCHKVQDLFSPPLFKDLSVTHLRMLNIIVIYLNASYCHLHI